MGFLFFWSNTLSSLFYTYIFREKVVRDVVNCSSFVWPPRFSIRLLCAACAIISRFICFDRNASSVRRREDPASADGDPPPTCKTSLLLLLPASRSALVIVTGLCLILRARSGGACLMRTLPAVSEVGAESLLLRAEVVRVVPRSSSSPLGGVLNDRRGRGGLLVVLTSVVTFGRTTAVFVAAVTVGAALTGRAAVEENILPVSIKEFSPAPPKDSNALSIFSASATICVETDGLRLLG